jgi:hypothetical protein
MFARDKFHIERRRAVATARLAHANDNDASRGRPQQLPAAPAWSAGGGRMSRLAGSNNTGVSRPCSTRASR